MLAYNVIIETPRGSSEKYDYDEKNKSFFLKKKLPAGMCFPHDFGFIPGTKGEDGDPLDAMVIAEFKTFTGCHISCRLIGAIEAEQTEKDKTVRNDRFFFIPEASLLYKHIASMDDLPSSYVEELIAFFINYNKQEGKEFKPLKILTPEKASKLLEQGMQA